jgi:hypothetical protein
LVSAKDDNGIGLDPAAATAIGGHIDPKAVCGATNGGEGGASSQGFKHRAAGRIIKIAALGANNGQSACALGQRNGRRVNRRRQQRDNQGAQQKQGNPQQGDPPPGLH